MLRSFCAGAVVAAAAALLAAPSAAEYSVKVSLSREDPDVRTLDVPDAEVVEFYLFIDGADTRGGEFGILIDGGELVEYLIDQEKGWVALPIPNAYPGTVAQAGISCYPAPAFLGTMRVKPSEPGAHVSLDILPSERSQHAVALKCDSSAEYGLRGFPAAINGEPVPAHEVRGDVGAPEADAHHPIKGGDDHAGHDHGDHGHAGHDHDKEEKTEETKAKPEGEPDEEASSD